MTEVAQHIKHTSREAVGVFHNFDSLEAAIKDLDKLGFTHEDISMIADEKTVEKKLGHFYNKVQKLEDDPKAPRTAFVSSKEIENTEMNLIGGLFYVGALVGGVAVVVSGGAIGAAIAGGLASGVGGQVIGSLLAAYVANQHADYIEDQLKHGGMLLWVKARNELLEKRAIETLKKHSAGDVHVHELPAQA